MTLLFRTVPRIDLKAPLTPNDIAAALPGLGLLIGYSLAVLVQITADRLPVTIEDTVARYEVIRVQVPRPHFDDEQPRHFDTRSFKSPVLQNGRPVLTRVKRTLHGLGHPEVSQTVSEVIVPVVGTPAIVSRKVQVPVPPANPDEAMLNPTILTQLQYRANVSWKPTGVYEIRTKVVFDEEVDRERWGIRLGVIASLFSGVYMVIRWSVPTRARADRELH